MDSFLNITIRVQAAAANAALSQVRSQITQVEKAASVMGASTGGLSKFTGSLKEAGYQLTTAFSLPLILAGKRLTSFVLDNEAATADLTKVYGSIGTPIKQVQSEVQALGKYFEQLSDYYGVNQTEVIQVGAAWAQAGVQGKALAESVNSTMRAMVIGDLSSTDATSALIAIQAQYHASSSDLVKILNTLNVVENQTGISMGGLITGFSRAAGSAADAGVDYRHLAAMLAAMTPAAGSAAQAGNSLKTIFSRLLAPTKAASAALSDLGFNTNAASWQSADASKRLELLAAQYGNLTGTQKAYISAQIASRYQVNRFDILMNDMNNYLSNQAKGLKGNAGALSYYGESLNSTTSATINAQVAQRELNTVLDSNPKRLSEISNILKNSLADVLVKLLPVILQIAGAFAHLATWFSNLSPVTQKLVGYFLLLLAAVGPIAFYISAFMKIFTLLKGVLGLVLAPFTAVIKMFGSSGGAATKAAAETNAAGDEITASVAGWNETLGTFLATMVETVAGIDSSIFGLAANIVTTFAGMFTEVATEFTAGGATMAAEWTAIFDSLGIITAEALVGIVGEVETGMLGIEGAITGGLALIAKDIELFGGIWEGEIVEDMAAIEGVVEAGGETINMVWDAALGAWVAETEAGMSLAVAAVVAGQAEINAAMIAGGAGMVEEGAIAGAAAGAAEGGGFFAGIVGVIGDIGGAIVAVLTSPWTLAFAAIMFLITTFPNQLKAAWSSVVSWMQTNMAPFVNIFDSAVRFVISAFDALPNGIQGALLAVVTIVQKAAMAVYNLFSYLNPFAHHSPSLVENVTAGMAAVRQQFSTLSTLGPIIDTAYSQITKFGTAIASMVKMGQNIDRATDLKTLMQYDPKAVPAYNALNKTLDTLNTREVALNGAIRTQTQVVAQWQAKLDAANASLTIQQNKLTTLQATQQKYSDEMQTAQNAIDNYSNAQIKGQGAMSDAIFANDQAQKALQLQMMKMEDVTGPIDDVNSKLASLRGEIESLQGEQKTLRENGAGSDITGGIQSQIDGLQGQVQATNQSAAAYDALNAQLDALQQKGQELDLENSLEFDPLTRQIQAAANAMKELPFATIMKGITSNQAKLKDYTAEYNKATTAVNTQQKAVDSATAARDKIQASYDAENKKLSTLTNAYNSVQSAISDITSALSQMTDAATKATDAASKTAKSAAGATSAFPSAAGDFANAGLGGNLESANTAGDNTTAIDKMTADMAKQVQDTFGKLNILTPIKKKIGEAASWVSANAGKMFDGIGSGISKAFGGVSLGGLITELQKTVIFKTVANMAHSLVVGLTALWKLLGPEVAKLLKNVVDGFKELWTNIGPQVLPFLGSLVNLFAALWKILKPTAAAIGILLLGAIKILASTLSGLLGPALHAIFATVGDLLQVLTGLINFVADVFQGKWGAAWKAVLSIFQGTFGAVWNIISGVFNTIIGGIEGFVMGIIHFFQWLFDELVGHSIIPDMINAIITWFVKLPIAILKGLATLGAKLLKLFIDAMGEAWKGVQQGWKATINFFKGLGSAIITAIGDVAKTLYQKGLDLLTGFLQAEKDGWIAIGTWLGGRAKAAFDAIGDLLKTLYNKGKDLIGGFFTAEKDGWKLIGTWLGGRAKAAFDAIGNLVKTLYNKGKDLIGGFFTAEKDGWKAIGTWLAGRGKAAFDSIGNVAKSLYQKGKDLVGGALSGLKSAWDTVTKWIGNTWNGITSKLSKPFESAVSGIKKFLGIMEKTVGTPIYGTVHYVLNPLIRGFNKIPFVPDMATISEKIPHFAAGGVIPGRHNRDDVPIFGTPGEVVVPKDIVNSFGGAMSLMDQLGIGRRTAGVGAHFGIGGAIGSLGSAIGGIASGIGGVVGGLGKDVWHGLESAGSAIASAAGDVGKLPGAVASSFTSLAKDMYDEATKYVRSGAAKAFMTAVGNPLKKADNFLDKKSYQPIGHAVNQEIDSDIDKIYTAIKGREDHDVAAAKKQLSAAVTVGNHKQLIDQALQLAGQNVGAADEAAVDIIVTHESGWNANAINLTDSNALAGHPSQGLMQTIPSTFEAYRLKSLPDVITDPIANMVAGIRYAASTYGSLLNVPGVVAVDNGRPYVGYDAGGLLPPGISSVFNGTGAPEIVTPEKTFQQYANSLSRINKFVTANEQGQTVKQPTIENNETHYHFYGDLSFPGVTNEHDASSFIKNLEGLAKG